MHDPAPVLRDTWMLVDRLLNRFDQHADALSRRITERALDLLEQVTLALKAPAPTARIDEADECLAMLRMLLRLAAERGQIDDRQLMADLQIANDVGRQLGGWLKSLVPL